MTFDRKTMTPLELELLEMLAKILNRAGYSNEASVFSVCKVPTALLEQAREILLPYRELNDGLRHATNSVF
jgi:hypothetical protein